MPTISATEVYSGGQHFVETLRYSPCSSARENRTGKACSPMQFCADREWACSFQLVSYCRAPQGALHHNNTFGAHPHDPLHDKGVLVLERATIILNFFWKIKCGPAAPTVGKGTIILIFFENSVGARRPHTFGKGHKNFEFFVWKM